MPKEYIEMIAWPRQGIPYKPTTKLTVLERYLMGLMLEIEADSIDKKV